ncbi:MAG: septum formation initiator family protein [Rickettsiaceae bacterium]|nr:septum formation initiator family protein [Rickettsiaceae bacterium]
MRLIIITCLFVLVFLYFSYHTIYGNRGILAKYEIQKLIDESSAELDKLRSERIKLEHKVKLLRPDSLDKDMLEEQAKKILGIAKDNEEVIIQNQSNILEKDLEKVLDKGAQKSEQKKE